MAANYAFTKVSGIIDKVLVWIHARRLGVYGDGQLSTNNALVLDGVVVGSVRTGAAPVLAIASGLAAAGAVTVTGTVAGDTVTMVLDMNVAPFVDVTSTFESTVSVTGQVQQTSTGSVSAHSLLFFVNPQAAA